MYRRALKDREEKEVHVENNIDSEASIDNPSMCFLRGHAKKERTHCEAKGGRCQDVEKLAKVPCLFNC